ncbi:MAG: RsmB/NOP family class I SAM-dependent RNA methyltransferase [Chthoniobacterales bacterium]
MQDPSTALACELLSPAPGEMVLDACAAPGGKASYLAETMRNEGTLIATDRDERRLQRAQDNFARLGVLQARTVRCDWRNEISIRESRLEPGSFDKILVDAPCSNTGVMRRRVDVRWRLQPGDFLRMPDQQLTILQAIAPFLRSGGSLVYSTCSLEPEENESLVTAFLETRSDFQCVQTEHCYPFREEFDGAFAARLERS